jgi:hypothetical protein
MNNTDCVNCHAPVIAGKCTNPDCPLGPKR